VTALRPDQPVAVVGAGTMGAGIAQVAAAAGHPVLLYDAKAEVAERAIQGIATALDKRVAQGKMTAAARSGVVGRITACQTLGELGGAALTIEAIVENLEVKQGLFRELEAVLGESSILATNTSSISITAIGAALRRPERLVGMHFFNPVPVMALVEVVSGRATDPEVAGIVFDTGAAWGKSPVHAKSTPGFIVNRVARPFYAEGLRVLNEGGGDVATLDAVIRESGGFRMGPFELMDLIGHDVNFSVTRSVYDAFYQDPRFTPSLIQQELVAAGFLGRKSGRGFYQYCHNAERPEPKTAPPGPRPERVTVHGELGALKQLLPLLEQSGIALQHRDTAAIGRIEVDERVAIALTDGRTATERMAVDGGLPLVLVDLALDFSRAPRVALAAADQTSPEDLARAAGLFQALSKKVSVLDDVPGLIVMRTVCMLANEGADAVNQGVCSAEAVDMAMRLAVNYPIGPLAWAQSIGLDRVVHVLTHLAIGYGEDRYRVSPLLRRKIFSGGRLL
jgi:3-hydroxybutyryl-CoA dehydrogenase